MLWFQRGPTVPLEQLQDRIDEISTPPDYKMYRPLSKESWYRDPTKVLYSIKSKRRFHQQRIREFGKPLSGSHAQIVAAKRENRIRLA